MRSLAAQLGPVVAGLWPGAVVQGTRRLRGGMATAAHVIHVEDGDGRRRLVLKRYRAGDAETPVRSRQVMEVVVAAGVAAPRPLWADAGAVLGVPALLYDYVPGRTTFRALDRVERVERLAATLAKIHSLPAPIGLPSVAVPGARFVDTFAREWGDDPLGSAVANALQPLEPGTDSAGLCHGDFYPANVAWSGGEISGVLDWDAARNGPPGFDLGYCRMHLALVHGAEAADALAPAYELVTSRAVDLAMWDLVAAAIAVGRHPFWLPLYAAGGVHVEYAVVRPRLEQFVNRAIDAAR